MDLKIFATVFSTIFLAELGDKTQLATMLFAADKEVNKFVVFLGSALALLVASAIAVAIGGVLANYINQKYLSVAAGIGFITVGIWTLVK